MKFYLTAMRKSKSKRLQTSVKNLNLYRRGGEKSGLLEIGKIFEMRVCRRGDSWHKLIFDRTDEKWIAGGGRERATSIRRKDIQSREEHLQLPIVSTSILTNEGQLPAFSIHGSSVMFTLRKARR